MLSFNEKILHLENYLLQAHENYADSFKEDINMFINDFSNQNKLLSFLNNIDSFKEIENWVDKLCSRIVLKFDSEGEEINNFIHDYIQFG